MADGPPSVTEMFILFFDRWPIRATILSPVKWWGFPSAPPACAGPVPPPMRGALDRASGWRHRGRYRDEGHPSPRPPQGGMFNSAFGANRTRDMMGGERDGLPPSRVPAETEIAKPRKGQPAVNIRRLLCGRKGGCGLPPTTSQLPSANGTPTPALLGGKPEGNCTTDAGWRE